MQRTITHQFLKWIPIWLIYLCSSFQASALSVIDLLIVYSPEAGEAGNGPDAMQQLAMAAVREMNEAHERSLSNIRFHLVGVVPSQETQSGTSTSSNLRAIRDPQDGKLDEIQGLRDANGADIVTYIFENDSGSNVGLANSLTSLDPGFSEKAFNVIVRRKAFGDWVLAHEIAHNLGAEHNRGNVNGLPGLTECAYGDFYKVGGESVHTIMAQSRFSERIGYFSNPNVLLEGQALGLATPLEECADNVSAMNMAGPFVAGFRPRTFLNDAFEDRVILNGYGFTLTGDLADSTREENEPVHNENSNAGSLWWSWTAPATDDYQVSFGGSSGAIAAVFYEGETLSSLQQTVSFLNQTPDNPSTFQAEKGVTYQIAATSLSNNVAFISLSLLRPNDPFDHPAILSGTDLIATTDSSEARNERREPNHGAINEFFGSTSNSVWWKWTAPLNGLVNLSTKGSLYGTNLGVYVGDALPDLVLVAEDAFERDQRIAELSFDAEAGETYRFAVAGPGGLEIPGGFTVLSLHQTPKPGLQLSLSASSSNTLILQVNGFTETDWILETSIDLKNWTASSRHNPSDLPKEIQLDLSSEVSQQYFRSRILP